MEHLKEFRALRNRHFDLVMQIDALTKETEELEVKDTVQLASTNAKNSWTRMNIRGKNLFPLTFPL